MGRPQIPLGTFGSITTTAYGQNYRSRCLFRDYDGRSRQVERHGKTKAAAERSLRVALRDRIHSSGHIDVTADTKVGIVAEAWFQELGNKDRSPGTIQHYRYCIDRQVIPRVGSLKVREMTTGTIHRTLVAITEAHGASTAKMARSVLSGIMGFAARHDAIAGNPVRDAGSIRQTRKQARALSTAEAIGLRAFLRTDEIALRQDIVELVDFMMATGMRIGEVAATTWNALDLDVGLVEIRGTVVRIKGEGLVIKPAPKSKAGFRILELPSWIVTILHDRSARPDIASQPEDPVFCAQLGGLRDPSNTQSDLRKAFNRAGFDWVTGHTFRRSVATWMDEAGLSARAAADQLGHSKPSTTADLYFGRKIRKTGAPAVLEQLASQPLHPLSQDDRDA